MATENENVKEDSTDTNTTEPAPGVGMIIDATTLQETLSTVGALVDECKIHLNENELSIRAVDPANVGMVDVTLVESAFEHYSGNDGVIGVNLDRLTDIAGMADSGQIIELELDTETRKLHIKIDGLEYTLALIDPNSIRDEPDLPDLDLPTEVVIESGDLARGIKAADMVSDHIQLRSSRNAEEFYMSAEGDTDDTNLTMTKDDLIDLVPGDSDSLYSLDYLDDMQKAMPKNVAVTLEHGEEFPVNLHFQYADGTGKATYMLAPRIQND